MPTGDSAAILRRAAAGLTYPSETDAPWTAFAWPDATGTPTAAEVSRRARRKASAPIKEQSVDDLFAPLVSVQTWYGEAEKATAASNRALFQAVKGSLKDARVFRIGNRKIAVYIVGRAADGGWAGLKTTAVET